MHCFCLPWAANGAQQQVTANCEGSHLATPPRQLDLLSCTPSRRHHFDQSPLLCLALLDCHPSDIISFSLQRDPETPQSTCVKGTAHFDPGMGGSDIKVQLRCLMSLARQHFALPGGANHELLFCCMHRPYLPKFHSSFEASARLTTAILALVLQ